ncbi:MAG TPA: V-type ATP synthase subunit K [Firmicutes bacterium]|jgi:V/A-type H+-transporting ATPase subunit K|nr:V-type ATP synthase subunit K [Bacillota bacterium]
MIENGILGLMGIGGALGLSALGTGLGVGAAGQSVVGAWKRAYMQNKPANFMLLAFTGFPLSQTFYGLILMNTIVASLQALSPGAVMGIGVFGGMAIGVSAWFQGVIGAGAADAYAETGKGFTNYVLVLGVIESVALLVMVFLMTTIGSLAV